MFIANGASGLRPFTSADQLVELKGRRLAFGDDRCIRFSCAVADETINDGLMRLKRLLRSF